MAVLLAVPSTAREADLICVLSAGKVAGLGTHEELLGSCQEYRNLLSREELAAAAAAYGVPADALLKPE